MTLYPALRDAFQDKRLGKADRSVLGFLAGQLSFLVYQSVKGEWVAYSTGLGRPSVVRALKKLTMHHYLEPGPRIARGSYTYRLVHNRDPQVKQAS